MGSLDVFRKAPHQKTFGVEIECYPIDRNFASATWAKTYAGFFYVTVDASLDWSAGGKEFVSQPMPFTMLNKQIKKLHKQLNGWRVDHRCGLHIHVSREYWSRFKEEHFSAFLRSLRETQITELFGRYSAKYAHPHAEMDEKFRAVNLLHPRSYEFRLWAAGELAWTLEALRRTKLIVEYKGKWSYEACLELFTKPEESKPSGPLINTFKSVVNNPPAVRRIRRAPAVPE